MKTNPQVSKYMTAFPQTINLEQPLSSAEKMMERYQVRHLPVLQNQQVVGVLTSNDIRTVESIKDINPETATVEDVFTKKALIVSPNSYLSNVCAEMTAHKINCALVCENKKLVGIFTWVDALHAFNDCWQRA